MPMKEARLLRTIGMTDGLIMANIQEKTVQK